MAMSEHDKLRIKYARLSGEFMGTLLAVLCWDIPPELKELMQAQIERIKKEYYEETNS